MLSNIELFPKDFKARELIQVLTPLIDKYTNKEYTRVVKVVRSASTEADYINQEYILNVNLVYSLTQIYENLVDYTVNENYITWITSVAEGTQYFVDLNYLDSEVVQDYEYKDELLDKILINYHDKSAALAYFITTVKPSLGTLYCIENLIKIIQTGVDLSVEEWFNTSSLVPFKFNINFDVSPLNLDIQSFIDYIFKIKNERSHLVKVGQDVCGSNTQWDYFTFDQDLYDDYGGVEYRGVKVCLQKIFKRKFTYSLQNIFSKRYEIIAGIYNFNKTSNYFNGDFYDVEETWDIKYELVGVIHKYVQLVSNGDMEADEGWASFIKEFLVPQDGLTPSADLVPAKPLYVDYDILDPAPRLFPSPSLLPNSLLFPVDRPSIYESGIRFLAPSEYLEPSDVLYPSLAKNEVLVNERSSVVVLAGNYSRYIEVKWFAGIISDTMVATSNSINVRCYIYPLQESVVNLVLVSNCDFIDEKYFNVPPNKWTLIGGNFNVAIGSFQLAIVGANNEDAVFKYYIDSVEVG